MVDRYFTVEHAAENFSVAPPGAKATSDALRLFGLAQRTARSLRLDPNQCALAANRATLTATGIDALALLGTTALVAPTPERHITPTEIAQRIGARSAVVANQLPERHGFQISRRDHHNKAVWSTTPLGEAFAVWLDTGKKQGDGTPVRQLKWREAICDALQGAIASRRAPSDPQA